MEKRSVEEITTLYPGLFEKGNGIDKLSYWTLDNTGPPMTDEEANENLLRNAEAGKEDFQKGVMEFFERLDKNE